MKKQVHFFVAVLLLIVQPHFAWADAGIWRGSLDINLNGTTTNYRELTGTGTQFSGANLGAITNSSTFQLLAPYLFSFKNSGCDVTGANFYYRVYKMGSSPGAYTSVTFGFVCNCIPPGTGCWRSSVFSCSNSTDQEWGSSSTNVNLLQAAKIANGSAGTYVLDVYWTITVANCVVPPALGSFTATFEALTSLPIELTAFRAEKIARSVQLTWTTATEQNNDRFELERSTDGNVWSLLTTVPTQNGNARYPQTYDVTDQLPRPARNYYRLRQVDTDGKSAYSAVRTVEMDRGAVATIAPNPVENGTLHLSLPAGITDAHVRLLDVQGRLLRTWTFSTETEITVPLDLAGLPGGILFLQVNGDTPLRVIRR